MKPADAKGVTVVCVDTLRSAGLTLQDIKENIPPFSLIIGASWLSKQNAEGANDDDDASCVGVASGEDVLAFESVSAFALFLCRRARLLRNERTLMIGDEDSVLKIAIALNKHNKEAYGGEGDTQVSDTIEVFNKLRTSKLLGKEADFPESFKKLALDDYNRDLKESNLVDTFDLLRIIRKEMNSTNDDSEMRVLLRNDASSTLLMLDAHNSRSADVELLNLLFPGQIQKLVLESPLDASLNAQDAGSTEASRRPSVSLEAVSSWDEVVACLLRDGSPSSSLGTTKRYCHNVCEGFLRLLVNARDELAVARAIAGPAGSLHHQAFVSVKREAVKSGMPMYQTIVSYVQRLKLGGRSYAPAHDHPFNEFQKELFAFVDVMDKLQARVEEEKTERECVSKILKCVKGHVLRSCPQLRAATAETYFRGLERLVMTAQRMSQRPTGESTPLRTVAAGGSVAGRNNMKLIRWTVDLLCTRAANVRSVHVILGKSQAATQSPSANATPLLVPSLPALFKSPEEEANEEVEDMFGSPTCLLPLSKQIKRASTRVGDGAGNGKPKYQSLLAWAPETSPLVVSSPAVSMAVDASPVTPLAATTRISEQPNEGGAEIVEKVTASSKMAKRAPKRRSILVDIANLDNVEPLLPKSSEALVKSVKEKKSGKNTKGRKEAPLIKGQSKLTTFFRV